MQQLNCVTNFNSRLHILDNQFLFQLCSLAWPLSFFSAAFIVLCLKFSTMTKSFLIGGFPQTIFP